MNILEIKSKYEDLLKSIKLCKDNEFKESVLILMYSTIDSLSWLNSNETNIINRNVKDDFICFCDKYIIKRLSDNITSEELYYARCAVVHTISSQAKNNVKNDIRYICYSNNKVAAKEGNKILNNLQENTICLDLIGFLAILVNSIEDFFNDVSKNSNKKEMVIKKAENYYSIY